MNGSFIPANTKKSTLVLGMYRLMPDIVILASGFVITIIMLLAYNNAPSWYMITACIPMGLGVFLTLPLPQYHNILCAIQSILGYYNNRRNYIWRGWCSKNEFK